MIDNKDTGEKITNKLTISKQKLTFDKSRHARNLSRNIVGSSLGANTVVVEVKRGKVISSEIRSKEEICIKDIAPNDVQVTRKLSILQKAREEQKIPNDSISTLSNIVKINQPKKEFLEKTNEDPNQQAGVDDLKDSKKNTLELKTNKQKSLEEESEKKKIEDTKNLVKQKIVETKKIKKSDIFNMLLHADFNEDNSKTRSLASIKRAKEKQRRKSNNHLNSNEFIGKKHNKVYREVIIPELVTVTDLSNRMAERVSDVIRELIKLGTVATANQLIDADTAELIATTFGHSVKRVQASDVENVLNNEKDKIEDLAPRAPIVTVVGHVNHGKTSILDALKSTDVVADEAGGITQRIQAYSLHTSTERMITFIDTPGHEAFTELRKRGIKVTDIILLVVAGDDGVKAQTIEAIKHAKSAEIPIIVAINKIDKPEANVERVKHELLNYGLVAEDLGGDTLVVPVSVKEKKNLDKLEEAILLVAEMEGLKANFKTVASGVIIESRIDKEKGVVTTILIQRGTLRTGSLLVAGTAYGRIRKMYDSKGQTVIEAFPSYALEILGLNEPPLAGEQFNVVITERDARAIIDYRIRKAKEKKVTICSNSLEELFQKASGKKRMKELPIIVKGDVQGSVEVIISSLNKLVTEEVKIKVIHQGVGNITESDISLSQATGSTILGFNVKASSTAKINAKKNRVDIRYFSIIYNLIDDIKNTMNSMLSPVTYEVHIGSVQIREVFNVSKVGKVAGSYVTKGIIKKGANIRLMRNNNVIHECKLKTLKRFKEDIKEVQEGFECGIGFENYSDIRTGDLLEVFEIVKEQKEL